MDNKDDKLTESEMFEQLMESDTEEETTETLNTENVSEGPGIVAEANRDNKGRFGKGNNYGVLTRGKKTKTVNEMKAFLMQFCTDTADDLYAVWDDLTPKDKAALFVTIVKYVMPTEMDQGQDQNITITMKPAPKREPKDGPTYDPTQRD